MWRFPWRFHGPWAFTPQQGACCLRRGGGFSSKLASCQSSGGHQHTSTAATPRADSVTVPLTRERSTSSTCRNAAGQLLGKAAVTARQLRESAAAFATCGQHNFSAAQKPGATAWRTSGAAPRMPGAAAQGCGLPFGSGLHCQHAMHTAFSSKKIRLAGHTHPVSPAAWRQVEGHSGALGLLVVLFPAPVRASPRQSKFH